MRDFLISIIIPCHGRVILLEEMLRSIPDRTDTEILVVDDHSDPPLAPGTAFRNATLSIVRARPGQRFAGSARNQGIDLARGEFLFFADSDDRIVSSGFSACLDRLPDFGGDLMLAHLASFRHDESGRGTRHHGFNWILREARCGRHDGLWRLHVPYGKFIRTSFVRAHGLAFSTTPVSNDVLFNLDLMRHTPEISIVDDIVYEVRQGNVSLTTSERMDLLDIRLDVLVTYNRRLTELGKKHLRSPAIGYLLRIARKTPVQAMRTAVALMQAGTPILPPPWTLLTVLRRRLWKR